MNIQHSRIWNDHRTHRTAPEGHAMRHKRNRATNAGELLAVPGGVPVPPGGPIKAWKLGSCRRFKPQDTCPSRPNGTSLERCVTTDLSKHRFDSSSRSVLYFIPWHNRQQTVVLLVVVAPFTKAGPSQRYIDIYRSPCHSYRCYDALASTWVGGWQQAGTNNARERKKQYTKHSAVAFEIYIRAVFTHATQENPS